MAGSELVLRGVDKRFHARTGDVQALQGIDLDLAEGEFVSVVGASGCGKSTLLRIVAGLEEASLGSLTLDGVPLTGPGRDRGMVFQQYTLYPWQTAQQNVEFGLAGMPRRERAEVALRYLEVVGLRDFAGAYPSQLSGGMQQRVAIARALALRPRILLMDEPFGALDAQTRSLMQELLLSIWERDRLAVLFVTHDIDEAIFLADRILVMAAKPGRVRELIEVPLERPRRYEQQTSQQFLELRTYVRGLIHDEAVRNTGFAAVLR
jgi:ABC-type nitrate/sulfonate/bicarbonate transport system ATPase subunit